jgi:fumarate reductase subunit C
MLWLAQRGSALVLALAVVVHLATIIGAVQGGLSAAEIVSRLEGHAGWLSFYLVFAAAAAVHAPIGLRTVLREWTALPRPGIDWACAIAGVGIALLGARAAFAMFHAPA